jgi:hypothetical protein
MLMNIDGLLHCTRHRDYVSSRVCINPMFRRYCVVRMLNLVSPSIRVGRNKRSALRRMGVDGTSIVGLRCANPTYKAACLNNLSARGSRLQARHALYRFFDSGRFEHGQRADPISAGKRSRPLQFGVFDVGI